MQLKQMAFVSTAGHASVAVPVCCVHCGEKLLQGDA